VFEQLLDRYDKPKISQASQATFCKFRSIASQKRCQGEQEQLKPKAILRWSQPLHSTTTTKATEKEMQHPRSRGRNNDLPFASCYEPAAAVKPSGATAAAPSAAAAPAGVCIMRRVEGQVHPQLDASILYQAGLKTGHSASCIPVSLPCPLLHRSCQYSSRSPP
jgi:hypothetical protein